MRRSRRNTGMFPESATPLIIFGRQRAGTRFVTDMLNSFEEVTLQGEIPNPVMKSIAKFIADTESYYRQIAADGDARRNRQYKAWVGKKPDLIFAMWANASQSRRIVPGAGCRYYGYKRPNNEFYFDFYEEHLATRKPRYVYCVRNFKDNYLSISSRWPDRTIEDVAGDYLASIAQYLEIKKKAPDRVLLFNLDDHIKLGFDYVESNIISNLGLILEDRTRAYLSGMGARNETEEAARKPRRLELNEEEAAYILSRPELDIEFRKLCCGNDGEATA